MTITKGKRREQQKAETRRLILESARGMFETTPYASVTLRAVASDAEIGLGTIYKHFPNKLSMLAAAFYEDLEHLNRIAFDTIPRDLPFKEQFMHLSRCFFKFYCANDHLSRTYLSQVFFYEKEWIEKINAFDKTYIENLTQLICKAQDRGEINKDKDCELLAIALLSNYFFVLSTLFLRNNNSDLNQLETLLKAIVQQTLL